MMHVPQKPFPYIGLAGLLFPTASQQMLGRREEERKGLHNGSLTFPRRDERIIFFLAFQE
jgi:hypothetical protein